MIKWLRSLRSRRSSFAGVRLGKSDPCRLAIPGLDGVLGEYSHRASSLAVLSVAFEKHIARDYIVEVFQHHGKNLCYSLRRDGVSANLGVGFAEGHAAGLAAPALNSTLAIGALTNAVQPCVFSRSFA
jgi:hypothetical protein